MAEVIDGRQQFTGKTLSYGIKTLMEQLIRSSGWDVNHDLHYLVNEHGEMGTPIALVADATGFRNEVIEKHARALGARISPGGLTLEGQLVSGLPCVRLADLWHILLRLRAGYLKKTNERENLRKLQDLAAAQPFCDIPGAWERLMAAVRDARSESAPTERKPRTIH